LKAVLRGLNCEVHLELLLVAAQQERIVVDNQNFDVDIPTDYLNLLRGNGGFFLDSVDFAEDQEDN
jgi:hypothetical protein